MDMETWSAAVAGVAELDMNECLNCLTDAQENPEELLKDMNTWILSTHPELTSLDMTWALGFKIKYV